MFLIRITATDGIGFIIRFAHSHSAFRRGAFVMKQAGQAAFDLTPRENDE